jgi:predicted aspartyl protease
MSTFHDVCPLGISLDFPTGSLLGIFLMDVFHINCTVLIPKSPSKRVALRRLLVDTGAEFTWIPADKLSEAEIAVRKKDVAFQLANGQIVTRDVGYAIIQVDGFETVDEVVFRQHS